MVERLTVRQRSPRADAEPGHHPDPLSEMDVWWERIGRELGREWDVSTADGCRLTVDVAVTERAYLLVTLLVGVRRDDVRVEVRADELRPDGKPTRRARVGITVRRAGHPHVFCYCATVPAEVDVDRIDAWLLDGVVVVRVPIEQPA